jgi:general secretion pathway protein D
MKIVPKIALLLMLALLAACATGRTSFDKARQLERSGNYDEAVKKYAEAVSNNPDTSEYRLAFLKATENAAIVHFKRGEDLLGANRYDEAYLEFQTAIAMDPGLDKARQQGEIAQKYKNSKQLYDEGAAFEKENKTRESVRVYQKAVNLNPSNKEAADALERLLKTKRAKSEGFELNLKSNKPITLKFKDAKIKDVFNIISQLSGINFVFDESLKDSNVTIYLENATFQQAMDIICGMQKLGRKILNESTIIIFARTPDKLKQYEELYVQTFFLNKLDAKKAVNLIRTMLQVKKIYVNEEMNTLVIRDTLDVIEVARRILEANDVPDAEVILEVEVIELSKNNNESFGLGLSRYAIDINTQSPSGQFLSNNFSTTTPVATATVVAGATPSATVSTSTTSQLLNLFRWGDYRSYITVPNATFNFAKKLGNAETLSNPKIRVKNREKAKFNVGTRVPITTTSSSGTGSFNVNVQYVDVGVKVNAEPTIQLNNDINIKLGLEVSSILSTAKVGSDGNTTVATIGTRNLDTVLSLKDGETSIIGGLIQNTSNKSQDKVFLLGDIPIIGQLFSNHNNSGDKNELILAITPRIVRGITVSDAETASFWSGVEDDPSVAKHYASFAQEPEYVSPSSKPAKSAPVETQLPNPAQKTSTPPALIPTPPPVQVLPLPVTSIVDAKPVTDAQKAVPGSNTPQAPASQSPASVIQPSPPLPEHKVTPPPPAKKVSIKVSAPAVVKQNDTFSAEIMASDADALYSAPMTLVYDPSVLEILSVAEGDLFKMDGKPATFSEKVDNLGGRLTVKLSKGEDTGGVKGSGKLFSVVFKAKSSGPGSVGFVGVKLVGEGGKQIEATLYNSVVEIRKP